MTEETAPSASAAALELAATSAAESAPPLLPAAAPIPLAGPSAPATTSEASQKKTISVKIDPKQGRLSFGKPGEGWKIARPPSPSPQVEDASVQVEGSGVGGGQGKSKKASVKGGKIKTVSKGLGTSSGTAKKGKGKVVDFEQEEIKALKSASKAVTGAEKGTLPPIVFNLTLALDSDSPTLCLYQYQRRVRKCRARREVEQLPTRRHRVRFDATLESRSRTSPDFTAILAFVCFSAPSEVLEVASVSTSPDPDASGTATAGPSKPRSNPPPKCATAKSKRKTVTVHLSSGSETEGGSITSKAGLSSLSIIIDDDDDEDDDDSPRPLSSPVAKPKKTAHPFFGGAVSSSGNKRPKLTSKLGASAELAIDVEAEDAAARPPASSWYVSRLGKASTAKASPTTPQDARWPTREETLLAQYAHLPSASGSALVPQEAKRAKLETLARADRFWHRPLPSAPVASSSRQPPLPLLQPVIPVHLAHHPAFDKLLRASPSHSSDLWADRFRPLAAGEVLGNETEASYLRDWLVAVQVKVAGVEEKDKRKAAKRQIVRKVDKSQRKKKKVSRKDDWIVEDDDFGYEDEADPIQSDTDSSDEDTIANLKRATSPQAPLSPSKLSHHLTTQTRPDESDGLGSSRAGFYPPLVKSSLSNCILLVGPSGSGKTAAIYACANELGWEIFEVYPGLRRSGVALTEMVGEVGRNHLVGRGGTGGGAAGASVQSVPDKKASLAGFFKKPVKDTDFGFMQKTEPLGGVDRASSSSVYQSGGGGETIRQSCILLEEVDILFQEDKGFWPAVVTLVSQSRRPVILTCNGEPLCLLDLSRCPLLTLSVARSQTSAPSPSTTFLFRLRWSFFHLRPTSSPRISSSSLTLEDSMFRRRLSIISFARWPITPSRQVYLNCPVTLHPLNHPTRPIFAERLTTSKPSEARARPAQRPVRWTSLPNGTGMSGSRRSRIGLGPFHLPQRLVRTTLWPPPNETRTRTCCSLSPISIQSRSSTPPSTGETRPPAQSSIRISTHRRTTSSLTTPTCTSQRQTLSVSICQSTDTDVRSRSWRWVSRARSMTRIRCPCRPAALRI